MIKTQGSWGFQAPEDVTLLRKKDVKGIKKLCKRNLRTEGTLVHHNYYPTSELLSYLSVYEREWQMEQIARDNQWQNYW